jgi:hypothetical protein
MGRNSLTTTARLATWIKADEVLAMHEAGITNNAICGRLKITPSQFRTLIEQGRMRRERRATKRSVKRKVTGEDGDNWCLPCDVRLMPSVTIPKGCSVKTLMTALHAIEQTRNDQ